MAKKNRLKQTYFKVKKEDLLTKDMRKIVY